MPQRIENTGVIETRCDMRHIADIALWGMQRGTPFRTRGELVRSVIEIFHEMVIAEGKLKPIESVAAAIELLGELGMPLLDRGGKRRRLVVDSVLQEQSLSLKKATMMRDAMRVYRQLESGELPTEPVDKDLQTIDDDEFLQQAQKEASDEAE